MMKPLMSVAVLLGTLGATDDARADVVTDRVLLVTGSSACVGATGFRRLLQTPDGDQTQETTEFQVPSGQYLEITSVEYTTPYFTQSASFYVQSLNLNLRKRTGSGGASVFSATYQNSASFTEDDGDVTALNHYVGAGSQTRVASFPVGPLMGPSTRLCLEANQAFWTFGGSMKVRGRLIPSGQPTTLPGNVTFPFDVRRM